MAMDALDLVVNDVNGPARIYRNRVQELHPDRSWLMVELDGEAPNTQAVGAQMEVWADGQQWYREHMLQRGFQSSVAPGLHIGLGEVTRLDSLRLRWPDGRITRMQDVEVPARIRLSQVGAGPPEPVRPPAALAPGDIPTARLLEAAEGNAGIDWAHMEDGYVDFARERLLVHMRSTEGPALCTGDITGNGLDDLYLGGGVISRELCFCSRRMEASATMNRGRLPMMPAQRIPIARCLTRPATGTWICMWPAGEIHFRPDPRHCSTGCIMGTGKAGLPARIRSFPRGPVM
jgi:hypothetical protein